MASHPLMILMPWFGVRFTLKPCRDRMSGPGVDGGSPPQPLAPAQSNII